MRRGLGLLEGADWWEGFGRERNGFEFPPLRLFISPVRFWAVLHSGDVGGRDEGGDSTVNNWTDGWDVSDLFLAL